MTERNELAKEKVREKTWNLLTNPFKLVTNASGSTIPRNVGKYLLLRRYLLQGDSLDQAYTTKDERKVITEEVLKEYEEKQPSLDVYLNMIADNSWIPLSSHNVNAQVYYTSFFLPAVIDEFNHYLTTKHQPHTNPEGEGEYTELGHLAHTYVKTHRKEHLDDIMATIGQGLTRDNLLRKQVQVLRALAYEYNKNYVDTI